MSELLTLEILQLHSRQEGSVLVSRQAAQDTWCRSYDFGIYNYSASIVCGGQGRFFNAKENIFCFQNALGYSWR
jgi:hypothetical protein